MHDIFLSYSRDDRFTAEKLAAGLEENGYSVWWDRNIPAGFAFDQVIQAGGGPAIPGNERSRCDGLDQTAAASTTRTPSRLNAVPATGCTVPAPSSNRAPTSLGSTTASIS